MATRKIRYGICINSVNHSSILENTGYDYYELPVSRLIGPELDDPGFKTLREDVNTHSIFPETFYLFIPPALPLTGPDRDKARIESYLSLVLNRIHLLGGKVVGFGSGRARSIPDTITREEGMLQLTEFMRTAAGIAAGYGITIAIENLETTETNVFTDIHSIGKYIKELELFNVGILFDIHHCVVQNQNIEDIANYASFIKHIHISDTGRLNPGTGQYPIPWLFEILNNIGYTSRVTCECKWQNFETDIKHTIEYLRNINKV